MSLALLVGSVNAACVNFRPPPKPITATLAGDAPTPVWTSRVGRRFTGPLALDDNTLYAGSIDRKVYAINLSNGNVRWTTRLPGMIVGGVLVSGETVFAASSRPQGRIQAHRRSSGKRIWRTPTPPVGAPLALIEGVLVAPTQNGHVLALDPKEGKVLWRRPLGVARTAAIRAGNGGILIATTDSLFRLRASDGRVTHRTRSPGTVVSAWLARDSALIAGTTDSQIVSISPENLRRRWTLQVDAPVLGAPAALGDTLYLASKAGTLYRIEPGAEPSLRTLATLDWPVTTSVSIVERQIFLGGADGVIRSLRPDGTEVWRVRVWRPVEVGPVPVGDGIVAVGGNGDLHRFRR